MKIIAWAIRLLIVLIVLIFSIRNTDPIMLRWLPGVEVQTPLVMALLGAFLTGAVFAWVFLLPSWIRTKRQLAVANKNLPKAEGSSDSANNQDNAPIAIGPSHGI